VAARRSAQRLYPVYLARVIKIEAVQCHREAVTDDYSVVFSFFLAGCRPGGSYQWSLDMPEQAFPGLPVDVKPAMDPVSPPMQRALDTAVVAFKGFIEALRTGELVANGMYPATGVRDDLNPVEWMREGLIFDVFNGDLYEGHLDVRRNGDLQEVHRVKYLRWSSIVVRAAIPERKLGRIDWDDWWEHEEPRRQQNQLPSSKSYLAEAEPLIKERYGVTNVPPSELRRIKAALYRGDSERPKRLKPKKAKHKR
jgi:hypothetical protein